MPLGFAKSQIVFKAQPAQYAIDFLVIAGGGSGGAWTGGGG